MGKMKNTTIDEKNQVPLSLFAFVYNVIKMKAT
jgi:hypothetical protein